MTLRPTYFMRKWCPSTTWVHTRPIAAPAPRHPLSRRSWDLGAQNELGILYALHLRDRVRHVELPHSGLRKLPVLWTNPLQGIKYLSLSTKAE